MRKEVIEGRYKIERKLGQGGMATVFLARDKELDRPVAYKLLADNLAGDDEARERFKREARIAARLSHPNIVGIFDVGEEDERPYIVMEYVDGESLAELVDPKRGMDPDQALTLVRQAAAGLGHAHKARIVHRDPKAQNMLLRKDGVLKVADFGIARAAEVAGQTKTGMVVGTPPFMAPEQMQGRRVSPATDVYGLGVLLYLLVTGRSPYEFSSLSDLVEAQQRARPTPLRQLVPEASKELERVIRRCLEPQPKRRYRSGLELEEQLAKIDAGTTPDLVSPMAKTQRLRADGSRPWIPRLRESLGSYRGAVSRRVVGVALAGVLLLGALLAVVTGGTEQSSPPPAKGAKASQQAPPPVPSSDDPADQTRKLSEWLRDNSR